MSRTFYYRQVQPLPEGEYIDLMLASKIREEADMGGEYGPLVIEKDDRLHSFIRGLAAAGTVEGAQELADAIERLNKIEVYVEF